MGTCQEPCEARGNGEGYEHRGMRCGGRPRCPPQTAGAWDATSAAPHTDSNRPPTNNVMAAAVVLVAEAVAPPLPIGAPPPPSPPPQPPPPPPPLSATPTPAPKAAEQRRVGQQRLPRGLWPMCT